MKTKFHFFAVLIPLLFLSKNNFGQIPDLKTAGQFALFTSSGAFTNIGASTVTGDIGTNVGTLTGFPPGTLIGQSYVADSVSAEASIDLNEANDFLTALSCDSIIDANLGNGQILYAGIYCITTAASLTGNLILDGQGNPNAIFILKINGLLSTTTFTSISLIDSANIKNVFWQVNGAFNLGENSIFKGNLIANGALSLFESSQFLGKGFSIAGAISLNNNIADTTASNGNIIPLPIVLISFTETFLNGNIILSWSTSSETNNNYFSIERSSNATTWEVLQEIIGAGNSYTHNDYSFTDTNPLTAISYYRLKQTDYDGKYKYSFIIAIENIKSTSNTLLVFPNPTKDLLNIKFEDDTQISSVKLFNSFGTEVYTSNEISNRIDLSGMKEGIYYLQVQSTLNTINKKIVIKD